MNILYYIFLLTLTGLLFRFSMILLVISNNKSFFSYLRIKHLKYITCKTVYNLHIIVTILLLGEFLMEYNANYCH